MVIVHEELFTSKVDVNTERVSIASWRYPNSWYRPIKTLVAKKDRYVTNDGVCRGISVKKCQN
jgi:hypothetical protein